MSLCALGCAAPQPAARTATREIPSPSYRQLEGARHFYAIVRAEPYRSHFSATFLHHEYAGCHLSADATGPVQVDSCAFPASRLREDALPSPYGEWAPRLRAALRREEPNAKDVHLRYEGTYRRVTLEEQVPCNGAHGRGFHRIELRMDKAGVNVLSAEHTDGSQCGALDFYWASANPQWIAFTSTQTLFEPGAGAPVVVPPALLGPLREVLEHPERDHSNPPSVPPAPESP